MAKNMVVSVDDMSIDQHDALFVLTELVRSGRANTRTELGRISGLGRSIVSQRIDDAISHGLLEEAEFGASTGGRMPRTLRFRNEIGCFVVVMLDNPNLLVAITDLAGKVIATSKTPWDYSAPPAEVLGKVPGMVQALKAEHNLPSIWGTSVAAPGPVEYGTGKMQASMLHGWNGFDIKALFETAFSAPCWVDNDVNLLALGEHTLLLANNQEVGHANNMLFVDVSMGIGAGIISDGKMHRGANGTAGDIGHIHVPEGSTTQCRCGQLGCLSAVAGGWALARDGEVAAHDGRSPYLAAVMAKQGFLAHTDIPNGANAGDAYCIESVARSGRIVGETLAGLVNFFNPGLMVVAGSIAATGDIFLAAVRQAIYRRGLPVATRDLRIIASETHHEEGVIGGAALAQIETFTRARMNEWVERRIQETKSNS